MDTSEKPKSMAPGLNSEEKEEVEEEKEEDEEHVTKESSYAVSQDLFETPQSSQSRLLSTGKPSAKEGISDEEKEEDSE
ncbi:cyclin-dependent kinase 11B-like isoform X1 [Mauremys reevesii]|uniref:cyclin-dependent kinase 11B-like isoform X1 n=1 Tax=Mauremys reevesii TaxID=260615 RepID=UPI00193F56C9|nr:cyclin-dependent kinase 11B-like isoform X1 [Mauremys reevesii]